MTIVNIDKNAHRRRRVAASLDVWPKTVVMVLALLNMSVTCGGVFLLATGERTHLLPVLGLFLFGSGSALVQYSNDSTVGVRCIVLVGVSMAVTMLTSQVLMSFDRLDPTTGIAVLTCLSAMGTPGAVRQCRQALRP